MLDASSNPVTGILYSDVTVTYKKQGGSSWSTKTVQSSDWSAGPDGRYLLVFSEDELDTDGRFVFRVAESGSDTFTGDIDLVSDWATEVAMLTDLINGLSGKVSSDAAAEAKRQLDQAIAAITAKHDEYNREIAHLQRQAAALLRKVDSLT
jgi:hypothetical protein